MTTTPPDGTVYLATDNRWYRWPDPAPYPSRDAAERQARPAYSTLQTAELGGPLAASPFAPPTAQGGWVTPEPTDSKGISRAMQYVAAVLNVIPVAAGLVAFLVLPKNNPDGRCDGIGFGCVLPPSEVAVVFALLGLVGTVAATAVAWLVMYVLASSSAAYRAWPPSLKAASILVPYAVIATLAFASYSPRSG